MHCVGGSCWLDKNNEALATLIRTTAKDVAESNHSAEKDDPDEPQRLNQLASPAEKGLSVDHFH
jgi:hypothetical protein